MRPSQYAQHGLEERRAHRERAALRRRSQRGAAAQRRRRAVERSVESSRPYNAQRKKTHVNANQR